MTRATDLDAALFDSKKKMISGTYLRNAWYVAAWGDELADGRLLARTILREPIVLYRKSDGRVAARKVDDTIRRLPGFAAVGLLEAWMDRFVEVSPRSKGESYGDRDR